MDTQQISPYTFEKDTPFERVKDVFAFAAHGTASMLATIIAVSAAAPHVGEIFSHFPLWGEILLGVAVINAVFVTTLATAKRPKPKPCCPGEDPCSHKRALQKIHKDFAVQRRIGYSRVGGEDKHSKNAHASSHNVAVGEKFIEMATPEEFDALMAHEMGHVKNRDLRGSAYFDILVGVNKTGLYGAVGFSAVGVLMGASVASTLLPAIAIFAGSYAATKFFSNAYSRVCERRADRMAVRYIKNPETVLSVLEKIGATPEWDKVPVYRNLRALCHTHPVGAAREVNIRKSVRGFNT